MGTEPTHGTDFGNASTHLLESLQSIRRTNPDLRVGHNKLCLVTMAATNRQISIRISVKISNFIQCVQKLSIFLLFCLYAQNVAVK